MHVMKMMTLSATAEVWAISSAVVGYESLYATNPEDMEVRGEEEQQVSDYSVM